MTHTNEPYATVQKVTATYYAVIDSARQIRGLYKTEKGAQKLLAKVLACAGH
jgi:hypothetical protein